MLDFKIFDYENSSAKIYNFLIFKKNFLQSGKPV